MNQITMELEAITPVFIAGADQRNIESEGLRPATLRGLMRWWFRAMAGGMTSIKPMQRLENSVFGSTTNKSTINVMSVPKPGESKMVQIGQVVSSNRYLWFSLAMQAKRNERNLCYAPKSKFRISLMSRDEGSKELRVATGALWALLYLGGVGSRMRRGGGSMKVLKVEGNTFAYEFKFEGKTLSEAKDFIISNLKSILGDYRQLVGSDYELPNDPRFFVFSKQHSEVALLGPYQTFEQGLREISFAYQEFRRNIRIDERHVLGLPIIDKLRRIPPEFKDERFASPLLMGVMELNGEYAVRLVKSYSSIHEKYARNLSQPRTQLNSFDLQLKSKEVKVDIPEAV